MVIIIKRVTYWVRRGYFKATYSCRKRNAGFHKARRSCLRERCVCWLCIPQQPAVSLPFVPDQFCLICLPAHFAYHQVRFSPLRLNQDSLLHTHTHTSAPRTHKMGVPLWNQNLLSLLDKEHKTRLTYTFAFLHRFQHGDALQTGRFLFLLEYIWSAVQLQETYMQSAPATERLKHAQCIKFKLKRKKKKSLPTQYAWHCWHREAVINHKTILIWF